MSWLELHCHRFVVGVWDLHAGPFQKLSHSPIQKTRRSSMSMPSISPLAMPWRIHPSDHENLPRSSSSLGLGVSPGWDPTDLGRYPHKKGNILNPWTFIIQFGGAHDFCSLTMRDIPYHSLTLPGCSWIHDCHERRGLLAAKIATQLQAPWVVQDGAPSCKLLYNPL